MRVYQLVIDKEIPDTERLKKGQFVCVLRVETLLLEFKKENQLTLYGVFFIRYISYQGFP